MVKYELENFCKPFLSEIDFIIKLDGKTLEFTGIAGAEYYMDANGTGHIVLVPAIELMPKCEGGDPDGL